MDIPGRRFIELRHVETQVFDWGRIQWLSEPRITGAERLAAGIVTLDPGMGHARHNHPGVEELLYVLEGQGTQLVEAGPGERRTVTAGTMVQIPPGVYHETVNTGDGPLLRLLAIYSPPGPEAQLGCAPGCRIEPAGDADGL